MTVRRWERKSDAAYMSVVSTFYADRIRAAREALAILLDPAAEPHAIEMATSQTFRQMYPPSRDIPAGLWTGALFEQVAREYLAHPSLPTFTVDTICSKLLASQYGSYAEEWPGTLYRACLSHPNISPRHLVQAAAGTEPRAQEIALRSPACPPEVLYAACLAADWWIRHLASQNPSCPDEGRVAALMLAPAGGDRVP